MGLELFFPQAGASASTALLGQLVQAAKKADEDGVAALWVAEDRRPGARGRGGASIVAAALSTQTKRLRIGGVVMADHHVLRIAEEWSVLDNLSGSRVSFCLDSAPWGDKPTEEVLERRRALAQSLKALWKGDSLTLPGGTGKPAEVRIWPRPAHAALPCAFWCETPEEAKQAALQGLGMLLPTGQRTVPELLALTRAHSSAWTGEGAPPEVTLVADADRLGLKGGAGDGLAFLAALRDAGLKQVACVCDAEGGSMSVMLEAFWELRRKIG
jgi:alkanesulfonate monooxygenase SsuD/methylene tetrahydromethanopterin reductase-like flavin-dependent oxidoreductase (luciferase family)